jgi:hypothetical protein
VIDHIAGSRSGLQPLGRGRFYRSHRVPLPRLISVIVLEILIITDRVPHSVFHYTVLGSQALQKFGQVDRPWWTGYWFAPKLEV